MSAQSCQSSEEQKFDEYVDALAAAMNHPQQKERLHGYCSGLLLPGERKSMEPIAAHLDPDRVQAMHHSVQHVITEGTWSDEAVLARVRGQVLPALHEHGAIRFWIVDESGIPRKGRHSVGVARQYCGELGKVDNSDVCCQYLEETGFTSALRGDPDRSRCHCALQETEPFRRRLIT